MFSLLWRRWRKKELEAIKPTGVVFNMWEHRGWGDLIKFHDWESRRIYGCYRVVNCGGMREYAGLMGFGDGITPNFGSDKPQVIQVGDEVREKMQGGKIGRFLVTELEYKRDPQDMFFGTVSDIGYLE